MHCTFISPLTPTAGALLVRSQTPTFPYHRRRNCVPRFNFFANTPKKIAPRRITFCPRPTSRLKCSPRPSLLLPRVVLPLSAPSSTPASPLSSAAVVSVAAGLPVLVVAPRGWTTPGLQRFRNRNATTRSEERLTPPPRPPEVEERKRPP